MKLSNPFSSRKPAQKLNVHVLTFLGEQDGSSERFLKGKLSELFNGRANVLRAYLARAHYEDPKTVSVCLCLGVTGGVDEPLVMAAHSVFATHFNRDVSLDILFLTSEQEDQLALVCKPFYQSK
jgi:hypothetical protein